MEMKKKNLGDENIDVFKSHLRLSKNSSVFNEVLSYVSSSDMSNVRLVCKPWEASSQAKWRSNTTLQINNIVPDQEEIDEESRSSDDYSSTEDMSSTEEFPVGNISLLPQPDRLTMKKFVEMVFHVNYNMPSDHLNLSEHPFLRLKINGNEEGAFGAQEDTERAFWIIVGPSLEYLHLNEISMGPDGVTHGQLQRILCELTPSLKELVYTPRYISSLYEPVLVDEVIRGIQPNLTSFTLNVTKAYVLKEGRRKDREFSNAFDAAIWGAINRRHRVDVHDGHVPPAPVSRPRPRDSNIPFEWELLFKTFPNLKDITHNIADINDPTLDTAKIHDILRVVWPFMLKQLNLIGKVRQERPTALNIESWNGVLFGRGEMTKFCELSLPLRRFVGSLEYTNEPDFHNFLVRHQATLRELTMIRFDDKKLGEVKNMWLPAGLTYLEVDRSWGDCLDWLAHVPNLETLIFNNKVGSGAVTSFSPSFGSQNVQPLGRMNEFRCKIVLNTDAFNKIAYLMPNLTKLSIEMDNERWMTASLSWSKLEYLEILQSFEDASVGLDEDAFVQYADKFEKLKKFVIQGSSHFKDKSIFDGFLKMPELRSVEIKFSSQVSEEGLVALKNKIPHAELQ